MRVVMSLPLVLSLTRALSADAAGVRSAYRAQDVEKQLFRDHAVYAIMRRPEHDQVRFVLIEISSSGDRHIRLAEGTSL